MKGALEDSCTKHPHTHIIKKLTEEIYPSSHKIRQIQLKTANASLFINEAVVYSLQLSFYYALFKHAVQVQRMFTYSFPFSVGQKMQLLPVEQVRAG